jgi:hypothetical protein
MRDGTLGARRQAVGTRRTLGTELPRHKAGTKNRLAFRLCALQFPLPYVDRGFSERIRYYVAAPFCPVLPRWARLCLRAFAVRGPAHFAAARACRTARTRGRRQRLESPGERPMPEISESPNAVKAPGGCQLRPAMV